MKYAKVFDTLWEGSMRGKSDLILVFLNILCHSDEMGVVDRHWRAICDETGLSLDRVKAAILELESPDPETRTPENEGRRLVRLDAHRDWGWQIVNHAKYRDLCSKRQNAEKQARFRARHSTVTDQGYAGLRPVGVSVGDAVGSSQEGDTGERIPPALEAVKAYVTAKGYTFDPEAFHAHYTSNGWKVGKNPMKNWHSACVTWQKGQPLRPQSTGATVRPSPNDRMVATVEAARQLDALKAQNAPSEDFQRLYAKWRQTWGSDFIDEIKAMSRGIQP